MVQPPCPSYPGGHSTRPSDTTVFVTSLLSPVPETSGIHTRTVVTTIPTHECVVDPLPWPNTSKTITTILYHVRVSPPPLLRSRRMCVRGRFVNPSPKPTHTRPFHRTTSDVISLLVHLTVCDSSRPDDLERLPVRISDRFLDATPENSSWGKLVDSGTTDRPYRSNPGVLSGRLSPTSLPWPR